MILTQEFTIHPVGQGLFYEGSISLNHTTNNSKFRFVYDCGSDQKKNCIDEVNQYNSKYPSDQNPIDLLIISHFDSDHVNCIDFLLKNRKVKKLVLPFLRFDERLFLALRMLAYRNYKGVNDDNFFSIRLILDPINTIIQDNQETEVVFIEPNIDSSELKRGENTNFDNYEPKDEDELEFDFLNKKIVSENDKKEYDISNLSLSLKKITDSDKGILKLSNSSLTLMEFLFYQKPLGKREKEFYKKVRERFENKFSIAPNSKFNDYVNAIKKIKKAEIVKKIYEEVFDELVRIHTKKPFNKSEISDLNVTSIALLHKNCFVCNGSKRHSIISEIQNIIKLNGRVEKSIINQFFDYDYYYRNGFYLENIISNVLLTSDGFLKKDVDYIKFYNHFCNYWGNFWLFQIPHHGSKNNIDKALLSIIPKSTYKFINYGTTNRHKHPSQELIENIIITGNSAKIIPINEFNGIAFYIDYYL